MAKFPDDAVDFAKDLERLGIRYQSVEAIAGTIGYSISHVSNLLAGIKPYAPGARTKIGEMIAKANGPVEPDPEFLTAAEIISKADDSVEPSSEQSAVFYGDAVAHYQIQEMPRGMFKVVCVAAMTHDHAIARSICAMLNKEGG